MHVLQQLSQAVACFGKADCLVGCCMTTELKRHGMLQIVCCCLLVGMEQVAMVIWFSDLAWSPAFLSVQVALREACWDHLCQSIQVLHWVLHWQGSVCIAAACSSVSCMYYCVACSLCSAYCSCSSEHQLVLDASKPLYMTHTCSSARVRYRAGPMCFWSRTTKAHVLVSILTFLLYVLTAVTGECRWRTWSW